MLVIFLSCCSLCARHCAAFYYCLKYYGRTVTIKIIPVGIHMSQFQSCWSLPESKAKVVNLMIQFCECKIMLFGVDDMEMAKRGMTGETL